MERDLATVRARLHAMEKACMEEGPEVGADQLFWLQQRVGGLRWELEGINQEPSLDLITPNIEELRRRIKRLNQELNDKLLAPSAPR